MRTLTFIKTFFYTLLMLIIFTSCGYAQLTKISSQQCLIRSFDITQTASEDLHCTPYHQTTTYTCGPAATMALLHYYGKLSSKEMNANTEMRIASEMGTTSLSGTTPDQVAAWLTKNGFQVELGHKVSADIIENNVSRGIPTLIVIEHHWTLATGFKESPDNNDKIIFTDSCVNKLITNKSKIDSMWLEPFCSNAQCNGDIGDYIIASPIK